MFQRPNAVLVTEELVPSINKGHFFTNQAQLTWLDNDNQVIVTYGCKVCFSQFNTRQAVGIHIGKIHNAKPVNTNLSSNPIRAIENIIADRDYWKKRALKLERQLRALGKALTIED